MYIINFKPVFSKKVKIKYNNKKLKTMIQVNLDSAFYNYEETINNIKKVIDSDKNNNSWKKEFDETVKDAFIKLFGQEKTETLINFFDNNILDMSVTFTPFLNEVVSPAIQNYTLEKQKNRRK